MIEITTQYYLGIDVYTNEGAWGHLTDIGMETMIEKIEDVAGEHTDDKGYLTSRNHWRENHRQKLFYISHHQYAHLWVKVDRHNNGHQTLLPVRSWPPRIANLVCDLSYKVGGILTLHSLDNLTDIQK